MSKVAIIGVGHVGAQVAADMVLRGTASELVLIDKNDKKALAEYYDLTDQQALTTEQTVVTAVPYTQNWDTLADCDVIVVAAGNIELTRQDGADRLAELPNSAQIVRDIAPKIKASGFDGIVINITNPCDVVATYLQQQIGLSTNQVIGTGTTLDSARMKRAVSTFFKCNMADVSGFVLGEHGETQFTAWSTVAVAGVPITHAAESSNIKLEDLKEEARLGGWHIMAGKGFTSNGIGLTATVLTEAVLNDMRQAFPLSAYDAEKQIYIGQVTRIGKKGVLTHVDVKLTPDEQAAFDASAAAIQHNFSLI